jgi:hypothetical protein
VKTTPIIQQSWSSLVLSLLSLSSFRSSLLNSDNIIPPGSLADVVVVEGWVSSLMCFTVFECIFIILWRTPKPPKPPLRPLLPKPLPPKLLPPKEGKVLLRPLLLLLLPLLPLPLPLGPTTRLLGVPLVPTMQLLGKAPLVVEILKHLWVRFLCLLFLFLTDMSHLCSPRS